MIKRIFKILTEVDENQVTLSPALVKHMIKHNRNGRSCLKVMPVCDNKTGMIGLDINPPYMVADAKYQEQLAEVQCDARSKMTGFQMEDPTVTALLIRYGMTLSDDAEKMKVQMYVEAKKQCGRWIYWIKPLVNKDLDSMERRVLWTAWLVKIGVF